MINFTVAFEAGIATNLRPNVKVEPPCVARSARTPGSIVASSTTGQQGKRPPTPSLPAGGAFTSSRPEAAAMGAAPWAATRSEQRSWSRAQRLADDILK